MRALAVVRGEGVGVGVYLVRRPDYLGYRVARWVGGRLVQHYFSLRRGGVELEAPQKCLVRHAAQRRDAELAREQHEERVRQQGRARPTARARRAHDTGVRGISLRVEVRRRGSRVYLWPKFCVHVSGIPARAFPITRAGWDRAWERAVAFWAAAKGVDDVGSLVGRRPDPAMLESLERRVRARQERP